MQAALVIQKCYRGFCARLDLAVQWAAAQTIQAAWRSTSARLRFGVTVHCIILVQVPALHRMFLRNQCFAQPWPCTPSIDTLTTPDVHVCFTRTHTVPSAAPSCRHACGAARSVHA